MTDQAGPPSRGLAVAVGLALVAQLLLVAWVGLGPPSAAAAQQGPCGDRPCAEVPADQGPCGANPCAPVPADQGPCGANPCAPVPAGQGPCGANPCAPVPADQGPCGANPCGQPATADPNAPGTVPTTDQPASATPETSAPAEATTTTTITVDGDRAASSAANEDDGAGATPWIVALGLVAVGGAVLYRVMRSRRPSTPSEP